MASAGFTSHAPSKGMSRAGLLSSAPSNTGNKTAEPALKSSWIERLKSGDALELVKGSSNDVIPEMIQTNSCQKNAFQKLEEEQRSVLLWDKAITSSKGASPTQRKDQGHVQNAQTVDSAKEVGKERVNVSIIPSKSSFGPWINARSRNRLGPKLQVQPEKAEPSSKPIVSDLVMTNSSKSTGPASIKGVDYLNQVSSSSPTQIEARPSTTTGKPPLPHRRSKPTLEPRSKDIIEIKGVFTGKEEKVSNLCAVVGGSASAGSHFNETRLFKACIMDSTNRIPRQQITDTEAKGSVSIFTSTNNHTEFSEFAEPLSVGKVYNLAQEWRGSCNDAMIRANASDGRDMAEGTDPLCQRETMSKNIAGLHSKNYANLSSQVCVVDSCTQQHRPENKEVRFFSGSMFGSTKVAEELMGNALVLDYSSGTAGSDAAPHLLEPAASSSTTASFPWEMFTDATDPFEKDREQFVQVYIKARDDLKNQRTSQNTSRFPEKQIHSGTRVPSGKSVLPNNIPAPRMDMQAVAAFSADAMANTLDVSFEQNCKLLSMNTKFISPVTKEREQQQHAISLPEGNNQVLLHREVQGFKCTYEHNSSHVSATKQHVGEANAPAGHKCHVASNCSPVSFRNEQQLPVRVKAQTLLPGQNKNYQQQDSYIAAIVNGKRKRSDINMLTEEKGKKAGNQHEKEDFLPEESPQLNELNQGNDLHTTQQGATKAHSKLFDSVSKDVAVSAQTKNAAVSIQGQKGPTRPPIRSQVWLQRWHQNIQIPKKMQRFTSEGVEKETGKRVPLYQSKDRNAVRSLHGATKFCGHNCLMQITEKEQGYDTFCSTKVLPSAAAMAIVGTAARQFRSVQPQRKGSFAFWSGFETIAAGKPESKLKSKMQNILQKADGTSFESTEITRCNSALAQDRRED